MAKMELINAGESDLLPLSDWRDDCYLYEGDTEIWCSLMIAKNPGQGAFSRLLHEIARRGKVAVVPCPLGAMTEILRRKGFVQRTPMEWVAPSNDVVNVGAN